MLYLKFFLFILKHKLHILKFRSLTGCGLKQALLHDLSIFSPKEFGPLARTYSSKDSENEYEDARNIHYNRNKHHHQYWVKDNVPMEIPVKYIREIILELVATEYHDYTHKMSSAEYDEFLDDKFNGDKIIERVIKTFISHRFSMRLTKLSEYRIMYFLEYRGMIDGDIDMEEHMIQYTSLSRYFTEEKYNYRFK